MRWMKLEPIIQNEVSQKEKHQYSILTCIYGIQKDGNDNPICETAKDTDVKNRLLDSVGEGEGGMIWENGIEICILPCKKQRPVYARYRIQDAWGWCTGLIQRDDMRWEVGREFRIGNSCTPVADPCQCMAKPIQYCKANKVKIKI